MKAAVSGLVTVAAPAKINLYLHVVGRRADGFHELDTLMVFAELGDRLHFRPADELRLAARGPFSDRLPDPEENLVIRAARRLADAAGVPAEAEIVLEKNLPVSAGLGSGSSDAAATLKGLSALWGIAEGDVDLAAIARELGSDVPACLFGRACYVGGTGEKVEPGPELPSVGILLVNPGVALATASVFEARRGGFSPEARFEENPRDPEQLATFLAERDNDLAEPAMRLSPVIGDVLAALEAAPGCRLARMSGSGATCFGLFDDPDSAKGAALAVRREGWWVSATRIRTD